MGNRDHPGPRPDKGFERAHVEHAVVVDRRDPDRRAGLLGHDLPRNDVRVVLHNGEHDLVAGFQIGSAPA